MNKEDYNALDRSLELAKSEVCGCAAAILESYRKHGDVVGVTMDYLEELLAKKKALSDEIHRLLGMETEAASFKEVT